MNSEDKKLILGLVIRPDGTRRITKDDFLKQFPVNPETDVEYIPHLLAEAFRLRDSEEVECGLLLGFNFGFSEKCGDILCSLLPEDWHKSHENIVSVLQRLKYPGAVEYLYRAALMTFPYLDYDDSFSLGVKCVWALYKIGSPMAKEKLALLAQADNRIVAKNAQERLCEDEDEDEEDE